MFCKSLVKAIDYELCIEDGNTCRFSHNGILEDLLHEFCEYVVKPNYRARPCLTFSHNYGVSVIVEGVIALNRFKVSAMGLSDYTSQF
jgi:hypothetical protein